MQRLTDIQGAERIGDRQVVKPKQDIHSLFPKAMDHCGRGSWKNLRVRSWGKGWEIPPFRQCTFTAIMSFKQLRMTVVGLQTEASTARQVLKDAHYGSISFCDGLHKSGSHKLICLNMWSVVGETVWEELGGVVLLKLVCYWKWALKFQKLMPFPVSCLPSTCG